MTIPPSYKELLGALDFVRATLKLRQLNEASDQEVEEALDLADDVLERARSRGQGRDR